MSVVTKICELCFSSGMLDEILDFQATRRSKRPAGPAQDVKDPDREWMIGVFLVRRRHKIFLAHANVPRRC